MMVRNQNKKLKLFLWMTAVFLVFICTIFLFVATKQKSYLSQLKNNNRELNQKLNLTKTREVSIREQYLAKLGHMKMIAGVVASIDSDQKKITVILDQYGERKKCIIDVNKKTAFSKIIEKDNALTALTAEDTGEEIILPELEKQVSSFRDLAVEQVIEVHFEKRIDIDNERSLTALEIVILPNN
ncbi:MAG: hypothetical protein U9M90_03240 [Patescibacteria group bacterium]|nr:hypothetical protein [Patescibacteria group bacterium]